MDSEHQFPHEVILDILLNLGQRDIIRCQLVCKHWYGFAQVARREAFLRRWGFEAIVAEPRAPVLFETIPPSSIVRRHCVAPGENVAQLALRYGVDATELMRLNNLMGPHLLQHRHMVYVPVPRPRPEVLRGHCASFEYSALLCRDLLIALPPQPAGGQQQQAQRAARGRRRGGSGRGRAGGDEGEEEVEEEAPAVVAVQFNRLLLREMKAHVRRLVRQRADQAAAGRGGAGGAGGGTGGLALGVPAHGGALLGGSAGSGPGVCVDVCSARFYLGEAGGCPEAAARMFVEDVVWQEAGEAGLDDDTTPMLVQPAWAREAAGAGSGRGPEQGGRAVRRLRHGYGHGHGQEQGPGQGPSRPPAMLRLLALLTGCGGCVGRRRHRTASALVRS